MKWTSSFIRYPIIWGNHESKRRVLDDVEDRPNGHVSTSLDMDDVEFLRFRIRENVNVAMAGATTTCRLFVRPGTVYCGIQLLMRSVRRCGAFFQKFDDILDLIDRRTLRSGGSLSTRRRGTRSEGRPQEVKVSTLFFRHPPSPPRNPTKKVPCECVLREGRRCVRRVLPKRSCRTDRAQS